MRYTIPFHAPDGEKFTSNTFANNIGKPLHIRDGDKHIRGILLAATVDEDGHAARLVLEVPDKEAGGQGKYTGRLPGRSEASDSSQDRCMSMGG